MGKLYKGQTALTIQLTTGVDITAATAKMGYKTPSGITGKWDAEIVDAENGIIKYDMDLSGPDVETGLWIVWADITFATGLWAPGEPVEIYIYEVGQ